MKLTIAALATLLSSVLATVYINNPVADTVWPHDGSPVTITWISSDGSLLTGTVIVQLMDGEDPNDLLPVLTIASGVNADKKSVTFTPPNNLPGSTNYAVRITSSVDGPHYSHTFTAGDPSISEPFSSSSSKSSSETDGSSTKETDKSSDDEDTKSSKEEDTKSSEKHSDSEDGSSEEDDSSEEPESDSQSEPESESDSSDIDRESSSSGAGRLQVAVGGLAGAAAVVAALF